MAAAQCRREPGTRQNEWKWTALRPVTRYSLLWPVFDALLDIADAEEGQDVAGGGNRDAQQTMALSGTIPGPSTAVATVQPQMLADRSTRLSIEDCEDQNFENSRLERSDPRGQGFVYLISMQNTHYYKIGMSLDPRSRLQMLQTGNPRALHLARVEAVSDMLAAESALHRLFEAQRVPDTTAREWFEFGDDEVLGRVEKAFHELARR